MQTKVKSCTYYSPCQILLSWNLHYTRYWCFWRRSSDDFSHLTQSQTSGFIWQNADICRADACTSASHAGSEDTQPQHITEQTAACHPGQQPGPEDVKLHEKKYDTNSLNPSLRSSPCITFKVTIHSSLNCHSPLSAPKFCFFTSFSVCLSPWGAIWSPREPVQPSQPA